VTPSQQLEEKLWPRSRNLAPGATRSGVASMDGEGQAVAPSPLPALDAPAAREGAPASCSSGLPTRRSRAWPRTLRTPNRPAGRRRRSESVVRMVGESEDGDQNQRGRDGRPPRGEERQPAPNPADLPVPFLFVEPEADRVGHVGRGRVFDPGTEVFQVAFDLFFGEPPVIRHLPPSPPLCAASLSHARTWT
jgi:hypothetical protein